MNTQLNIFILLFGTLQAALLVAILLKKKAHRSGYIFLIAYLLVMLLQVLTKAMSKGWLMTHMETVYFASYQLPFLYGPLAWLCTRSLLRPGVNKIYDALHFIPFVYFAASAFAPLPGATLETRLVLQLASVVTYHWLALNIWRQHRAKAATHYSTLQRNRFKWLSRFIGISAGLCTMITVAIFLLYLYYPVWTDVRWAFTGLVLFIYWVSYRAWVQPELFTVVHGSGEGTPENYIPALRVHHPVKKYANSTLQPEDARSIEHSLRALLEAKVYLDAGLTIDQLARQAGCNKHHLSQVLNECMGMSYHDCINSYRVEEAKTLLHDPANAGLKIAALAYEAGFNSLSSFNDVFKKVTGETPSAFRNSAAAEEVRQRS